MNASPHFSATSDLIHENAKLREHNAELLALVRWSCAWANGWTPTKAQKDGHHLNCLSVIEKATGGKTP